MATYKIIQKINETNYKVQEITAVDNEDYYTQVAELKDAFPNVWGTGWCKTDYRAGKFVIRWLTNFNYGKQSYSYAFVLYINESKGTRTFIDYLNNVNTLEDVGQLMNKYTNLSIDDIWELLDNSIHRLGLYHSRFKLLKDYNTDLEFGYNLSNDNGLDKMDYDYQCLKYLNISMQTAVQLNVNSQVLYSMSTLIKNDGSNAEFTNLLESLKRNNEACKEILPNLIYNGRKGNDHFSGNFDILKYPLK